MRISSVGRCSLLIAVMVIAVIEAGAQGAPARAQPPARPDMASAREVVPTDATGRCRDGSFTSEAVVATACIAHGGTLVTFSARQPAPPRPVSASVASRQTSNPRLEPAVGPNRPPVVALNAPPKPGQPVAPELGVPTGARARCRDGTFVSAGEPASACQSHAGVAVRFAAPDPPPPPRGRSARPDRGAETPIHTRPDAATGQCKDGSYLVGTPDSSSCAANGGIAAVFPVESAPTPRVEAARPEQVPSKSKAPVRRARKDPRSP